MIELRNVTRTYTTRHGRITVLDGINLRVTRGEKLGLIGGNGAGKSTLIRLLSGAELPTSGTIRRDMSVSWPLAFSGGFQGSLTGLDNLRFIARVYGQEWEPLVPFVDEFSELGRYLREPVKHYSSGMRARLAFALSMAIEFDCYLIDEVIAVGDARFQQKCERELFERRADRAMILVSHMPEIISEHCNMVGVIHNGRITEFDDVKQAYDHYAKLS